MIMQITNNQELFVMQQNTPNELGTFSTMLPYVQCFYSCDLRYTQCNFIKNKKMLMFGKNVENKMSENK